MPTSRLSALQERILRSLAPAVGGWRLIGGGALVGFYLFHRETRDLDLQWSPLGELGDLPARTAEILRHEGLEVSSIQVALAFHRLRVAHLGEVTNVDLIADPAAPAHAPESRPLAGATIALEPIHDVLVSKLCALLGRAEVRDLIDVRALLAAGQDLRAAVTAAPFRDGGFSAPTLAWVLQGLNVVALARAAKVPDEEARDLAAFVPWLVGELLGISRPG
jgi:hypothetical protein